MPVSITPLRRGHLGFLHTRPRGFYDSTDFAITRFLVPYLSGYTGYSIFMDCDMLVLDDLSKVLGLTDDRNQVSVCQHDYIPRSQIKMDGQKQTQYRRKNWSSFMVFNNRRCRELSPTVIDTDSGLDLHAFSRLSRIGALPLEWNWLVGEYEPNHKAKVFHYTLGGPWMSGYENTDHAEAWYNEFNDMTQGCVRSR